LQNTQTSGRFSFFAYDLEIEKRSKQSSAFVRITDGCLKCGLCRDQCPAQAIAVKRGVFISGGACVGCAACVELCPAGAVRVIDGSAPRNHLF
jgi:NAD-dependent dihydropyrimidine dehydrogenase PreA subunit